MPNTGKISVITIPAGNSYDIKDSYASHYLGTLDTETVPTTSTVTIGGQSVTAVANDWVTLPSSHESYIYKNSTWTRFTPNDCTETITDIIDTNGPKNFLRFSDIGRVTGNVAEIGKVFISNGVRWVLNGDYTITATRISSYSVDSSCNICTGIGPLYIDDLCDGNHVLSCSPVGGTINPCTTWNARALSTDTGQEYTKVDLGEGVLLDAKPSGATYNIFIPMVYASDVTDPVTFKPMICTKEAWEASHKYVPPTNTNAELSSALATTIDKGPKNLLPVTPNSGGTEVVYTFNSDGTIDAVGTATSQESQRRVATVSQADLQKYEGMIISGCPNTAGSMGICKLVLQLDESPYTIYAEDTGDGAVIPYGITGQCRVMIKVFQGQTIDATFKPMICTEEEWAISKSHEPYRPQYDDLLSKTGNAYRTASIPMGTVDSTSTSTAYTATIDGITELRDGVCCYLTNNVVTSASGFTININGLGGKPLYRSNAAATAETTRFAKGLTILMVYNSTRVTNGCWDFVYGYDSNTTYTPPSLGFGYGTCSTAADTAAKTVSITNYALTTGAIVTVKFTNAVPANATLNITSKGAKTIYYRGAAITAGIIEAGDTVTFVYSTYYHIISIDKAYSLATMGIGYGEAVLGTSPAFSVTLNNYINKTGGLLTVKFSNDVPANATLNVNSQGASAIYYRGSAITSGKIKSGDVVLFARYSAHWNMIANDRYAGGLE